MRFPSETIENLRVQFIGAYKVPGEISLNSYELDILRDHNVSSVFDGKDLTPSRLFSYHFRSIILYRRRCKSLARAYANPKSSLYCITFLGRRKRTIIFLLSALSNRYRTKVQSCYNCSPWFPTNDKYREKRNWIWFRFQKWTSNY